MPISLSYAAQIVSRGWVARPLQNAMRTVTHVTLGVCLAAWMGACGQDRSTAPSLRAPDQAIGPVTVFPLNAVMAVGDTLTIQISARTLSGAPLTTYDSVEYVLQNITDTLHLRISPTGIVTALGETGQGNPALLQVIVFKDGLARADQAVIQVTNAKILNARLSIQPVAPDSAKLAWGDSKQVTPAIYNVANDSVLQPTIRFEYDANDSTLQCYAPNFTGTTTIAASQLQVSDCGNNQNGQVGLNQIHALRRGTGWLHANVMVYNVMLHDSVQYTLTNPYTAPVQVAPSYLLGEQTYRNSVFIAPGGQVAFINGFDQSIGSSVSWTFEHPDLVTVADPPSTYGGTTGDISSITPQQLLAWRRFNTPGVYKWTAHVTGGLAPYAGGTATGTVTVE